MHLPGSESVGAQSSGESEPTGRSPLDAKIKRVGEMLKNKSSKSNKNILRLKLADLYWRKSLTYSEWKPANGLARGTLDPKTSDRGVLYRDRSRKIYEYVLQRAPRTPGIEDAYLGMVLAMYERGEGRPAERVLLRLKEVSPSCRELERGYHASVLFFVRTKKSYKANTYFRLLAETFPSSALLPGAQMALDAAEKKAG
mgnify:CR=1 FL=1